MITTAAADRHLMEGLQRRDPTAAERLVEQRSGWIHRVVHRVLSDIRDVEEVTRGVIVLHDIEQLPNEVVAVTLGSRSPPRSPECTGRGPSCASS